METVQPWCSKLTHLVSFTSAKHVRDVLGAKPWSSSGASAVFWRRAGVQAFTTHVRPKFGVCIPKAFLKHMLCSIL